MSTSLFPSVVVGIASVDAGAASCVSLLEQLSAGRGLSYLLLPPDRPTGQGDWACLEDNSTLPLVSLHAPERMLPDHVYVVPDSGNVCLVEGEARPQPDGHGLYGRLDQFFINMADAGVAFPIGVILGNVGDEARLGMRVIQRAGGVAYELNPVGPGNAAIDANSDRYLSMQEFGQEIARVSAALRDAQAAGSDIPQVEDLLKPGAQASMGLRRYRRSALQARIRRRMGLLKLYSGVAYGHLLTRDGGERDALLQDIAADAPRFFREPARCESMKAELTSLLRRQPPQAPLRIWSVGCGGGEEVYSLAMLAQEAARDSGSEAGFRIFGTDIDAGAIERARSGWYSSAVRSEISAGRLSEFFHASRGGFKVVKSLRNQCTFSVHDILSDPPLARMDVLVCRGLLPFLHSEARRRLLEAIYFSLRDGGLLLLGEDEAIGVYQEGFVARDLQHSMFERAAAARSIPLPVRRRARQAQAPAGEIAHATELELLDGVSPSGVLVRDDGEVLDFTGDTALFLSAPRDGGRHNLLQLLRDSLNLPVRTALRACIDQGEAQHSDDAWIDHEHRLHRIRIRVIPAHTQPASYWVLFTVIESLAKRSSQARGINRAHVSAAAGAPAAGAPAAGPPAAGPSLGVLSVQRAANGRLRSANRVVSDSNVRLRRTIDELVASQEQIQSGNNELAVLVDELRIRKRELDQTNEDLNNLFDTLQVGVVMLWRDLRIRRFTRPGRDAFNLHESDVGRSICEVNHNLRIPDLPGLLRRAVDAAEHMELEVESGVGHCYLLRIRPTPAQGTQPSGIILELIDIQQLAEAQKGLRQRVAELARADRHKDEFLAILAHELRNPLAPLLNAAQILHRAPDDKEVVEDTCKLIERQVRQMSRLVGDLLDAARARHGQIRLQLEPLDLRSIVSGVVDAMRPAFEARRQSLQMTLPAQPMIVCGDVIRLDQIVSNLLRNANKYTLEGGHIQVVVEQREAALAGSLESAGFAQPLAVVRVGDDGIGIDPDLLPRVFDLFTQADRSLAHADGGLGIGLSLVNTLVKLHRGEVSAHSAGTNCGSVFEVRLPLEPLADRFELDGAPLLPVAARLEHPAQRVLVVDDQADVRDSTATLLEMEGYEVQTAGSGEEALRMAADSNPGAVVLDIGLPDIDGYEVARRLRILPHLQHAHIIGVSGYDSPEARERSVSSGFDHLISKPVSFEQLHALLSPIAPLVPA